jgi:DNA-binding transcriptional LysR family regulator
MFTLEQIRCFVAVAEELHFGRAAERLQMTQPPLSRQIQKLERSLGVTLLQRDHRAVSLTPAGAAFLGECREILSAAERAPLRARNIGSGHEGALRIGFTAGAGFGLLGRVLERLAEGLPHVALELEEMVSSEQRTALARGALDVGLARPLAGDDAFGSHLLFGEDLMLVVPDGHPLAGRDVVDERELAGQPLIMYSPTSARYFYDLLVRLLAVDPAQVVHTVSQITTMVALVGARRGIALVPASSRFLGVKGVSFVSLGPRSLGIVQLHATWKRTNTNPALHRALPLILDIGSPA